MKKGEESRQLLIECAAELLWKNGYSATGISEILKQTDLPKGSFYFYFKSKDDLATAVTEYYQKILLEQFRSSSQGNDWESFIEEIFDYLFGRATGQTFAGCPYAVMGMETALKKTDHITTLYALSFYSYKSSCSFTSLLSAMHCFKAMIIFSASSGFAR